ncbi:MAG: hypothetical protein Q9195_004940 [Heterodermia aff. obscurata]
MAPKVFLTGATGYIGGDALVHLVENHPEYEITTLVRNSEKGAQVASQYARVRLVYGDLDSEQTLEEEAKKADIVLHCASADHEGALNAIIRGLATHGPENPGYLIQTSGTGILCFGDVERKIFGAASTKVFDDWEGIGEITSLPDFAPHRKADKVVLAAAAAYPSRIRTAIVCPPCIYGKGRGPGNQRSIQMPDLTKATLKEKKAFQVGEGLAVFLFVEQMKRVSSRDIDADCENSEGASIHVHDLSDCFLKLVEAAASGGGNATWDEEGYYFTENDEHAWGQMSKLIAEDAHKKALIPTDEVASVSAEDADRLRPHGFLLWGANSRCKAIRAKRLLGWSPTHIIKNEVSELVDIEARSLGLTQGHAAKVGG